MNREHKAVNLVDHLGASFESALEPGGAPSCRTRRRILEVAFTCYVEDGYTCTGLDTVASRADLTIETVEEHFGGTLALYSAVWRQAEFAHCQRLRAVAAKQHGLVAAVGAILDEIVRQCELDPTLPQFLVTAAIDSSRHPEIREAVGPPWAAQSALSRDLTGTAVAAGEVGASEHETIADTITAMTIGLLATEHHIPEAKARAAEGLMRLLRGQLVARGPGQ